MKKMIAVLAVLIVAVLCFTGCSGNSGTNYNITGSLDIKYAKQFKVDCIEGGSYLVTINDSDRYVIVPEGAQKPENTGSDTVLSLPLNNMYLVNNSAMNMVVSIGGLDSFSFCSTKESDWYIDEVKDAMKSGRLKFAGKYSAPDYEMLTSGKCSLAIENTMINHTPEVKEMLQSFNIPVLTDYGSNEETPQGRMEWVKLYGILTGKQEQAQSVFDKQIELFDSIPKETTGKTCCYFFVTTGGEVSVRNKDDFLADIFTIAGGNYIYDSIGFKEKSTSPTQKCSIESFYNAVKDADVLFYNNTINDGVRSMDDFVKLNPLFKNLKAVQTGNVYVTDQQLFQMPMELGEFAKEVSDVLRGQDGEYKFITRLK